MTLRTKLLTLTLCMLACAAASLPIRMSDSTERVAGKCASQISTAGTAYASDESSTEPNKPSGLIDLSRSTKPAYLLLDMLGALLIASTAIAVYKVQNRTDRLSRDKESMIVLGSGIGSLGILFVAMPEIVYALIPHAPVVWQVNPNDFLMQTAFSWGTAFAALYCFGAFLAGDLLNRKQFHASIAAGIMVVLGGLVWWLLPDLAKPLGFSFVQPRPLFMWEISKGSGRAYLLGSIHILKSSFYPLPEEVEQAYNSSSVLTLEVDINSIHPEEIQAKMPSPLLQGGDTLFNHLSQKTATKLQTYIDKHPEYARVRYLKPAVAATVLPGLELRRLGFDPKQGLDMYFLKKANASGKHVDHIETIQSQMQALESMTNQLDEDQMVSSALDSAKDIDKVLDLYLQCWKHGDAEGLQIISKRTLANVPPAVAEKNRKDMARRNIVMAETIEKYTETGQLYFVVVGCLHMGGPDGILQLVKNDNFNVRQICRPGYIQFDMYDPEADMKRFDSGEGGFAVDLPGVPDRVSSADGRTYYYDHRDGTFKIVVDTKMLASVQGRMPGEMRLAGERVLDSLSEMNGKYVEYNQTDSTYKFQLNEFTPAYEVRGKNYNLDVSRKPPCWTVSQTRRKIPMDQYDHAAFAVRMFASGPVIYAASVEGKPSFVNSPMAQKFLESFSVTGPCRFAAQAPVTADQSRLVKRFVGVYQGTIGEDGAVQTVVPVGTTLLLSPSEPGKLVGEYTMHCKNGALESGKLVQEGRVENNAITFRSSDRFGTGTFKAEFNDSWTEFHGTFRSDAMRSRSLGISDSSTDAKWIGKR